MSPLLKGKTNDIISNNVKELRNSGRNEAQATAIALSRAGRGKGKKVAHKVAKKRQLNTDIMDGTE